MANKKRETTKRLYFWLQLILMGPIMVPAPRDYNKVIIIIDQIILSNTSEPYLLVTQCFSISFEKLKENIF